MAMELIAHSEVGSGGASSIEFTSIPQDGVDLVIKLSARNTDTAPEIAEITLNSDSGSNYSQVSLTGSGTGVSTQSITLGFFRLNLSVSGDTSNTFGNGEAYISNYTSSTDKSISGDSVSENNGSVARQRLDAISYSTTSPITSIQVSLFGDNYAQYSTASLYKIY